MFRHRHIIYRDKIETGETDDTRRDRKDTGEKHVGQVHQGDPEALG